MDRGLDFVKSQVNNAVMQHQTFLDNLEAHEGQAEDQRFRDLCSRFIPKAREHQRMLESYQQQIGAEAGAGKKMLGKALGVAKDIADKVRESDFLRLVSDIVMARQAEDTFKTFREAGKALGIQALAQLGDTAERDHDAFHREANKLAQQLFIEHARGAEAALGATASQQPSAGT